MPTARSRVRWLVAFLLAASVGAAENISVDTVPALTIEARLKELSDDNATRHDKLKKLFAEAGCTGDALSEQQVSKKGPGNVICTLPGPTDRVIIVSAHFDTISPSHGAADNWSGVSLLPSFFQAIRNRDRKHTFVFIGFTDEEEGLVGSEHYVRKLSKQQKKALAAVINIDTLGLSTPNVWQSHSDKHLVDWFFAACTATKLPLQAVEIQRVGSTDSESFAYMKVPRISISSVTRENIHLLHTAKDRVEAINLDLHYRTYEMLALYLISVDGKLN
jgi:hypothetical protein